MQRWKSRLSWLFAAMVLLYAGICTFMYVRQRALVFPAPKEVIQTAAGAEIVRGEGLLYAWSAPPTPDAPVVVFFHGNGGQALRDTFLGDWAREAGAGYAAVEYPGYGLLEGSPSEESILGAARAALEDIAAKAGRERLRLVGQSLGSGVAMAMAAEGWGSRVMLVSPYTALPDVAALQYPWLPVRLLMKDTFDSFGRAPGVKVPVRVLHGDADTLIPHAMGERLAARLPHGELVTLPGAGHGDMWKQPQIRQLFVDFLINGG